MATSPILLTPRYGTYTGQSPLVKKFVSFKMERLGLIGAAPEPEIALQKRERSSVQWAIQAG
jgi:hypothetical protein